MELALEGLAAGVQEERDSVDGEVGQGDNGKVSLPDLASATRSGLLGVRHAHEPPLPYPALSHLDPASPVREGDPQAADGGVRLRGGSDADVEVAGRGRKGVIARRRREEGGGDGRKWGAN
ncbi:hypothetical protein OsI_25691 [Oryza sativa Indica Group]|uniref:Uncharacterized protein n=1 Tax=Oryza sativa subsp. indica TaxID=39946 RepID=A2YKE4_ORYSI|nr:hypothetical protein OsI_25691 [Oryza sativa Indica Group]